MTALAFVTGFVAGAGTTYLIARWYFTLRYDLHTYHQVALDALSLKAIEEVAVEQVHEARCEAKEQVGDLLDTVADLRHTIETLTVQPAVQVEKVRTYDNFDYGVNR